MESTDRMDIANVDLFVDEALDTIAREEPSLRDYLQDEREVTSLLEASTAAIQALIIFDYRKQIPLERSMLAVETIVYRAVAAGSLAALMRERKAVFS